MHALCVNNQGIVLITFGNRFYTGRQSAWFCYHDISPSKPVTFSELFFDACVLKTYKTAGYRGSILLDTWKKNKSQKYCNFENDFAFDDSSI